MTATPETSMELPCPSCGYDLRGLTSDRCPECGAAFDVGELRFVRPGIVAEQWYADADRWWKVMVVPVRVCIHPRKAFARSSPSVRVLRVFPLWSLVGAFALTAVVWAMLNIHGIVNDVPYRGGHISNSLEYLGAVAVFVVLWWPGTIILDLAVFAVVLVLGMLLSGHYLRGRQIACLLTWLLCFVVAQKVFECLAVDSFGTSPWPFLDPLEERWRLVWVPFAAIWLGVYYGRGLLLVAILTSLAVAKLLRCRTVGLVIPVVVIVLASWPLRQQWWRLYSQFFVAPAWFFLRPWL